MARLREWTSAPIIALLARSQSHEKAGLLDAGANDCIVKPVGPVELVARMHVWLRAKTRRRTYEPRAERLRIDRERRALFVDGREIHLTPIEYKVLLALARRPGVPMTEAQLLASVWGKGSTTRAQLLHAHVRRLKQKIERDPARPTRLLTEIDGGYWLKRARWTTG
jgi:two-component system KDP operon response regulator KdpE